MERFLPNQQLAGRWEIRYNEMTFECAHGEGAAVSIIIGEKQWVTLISLKR